MLNRATDRREQKAWLWLGPLLYVLVVGMYFSARFMGRWSETDSAVLSNILRVFIQAGQLVPTQGDVYSNGYTFQAISAFIVACTGLEVATLQQLIYPILAAVLVLPAWLMYRVLTGSSSGAALATMLLFTQPEFLFVILRSSHEKFTRLLMLLSVYLLARSFKLRHQPGQFAIHVGLFYTAIFALIASNNLLAHSFIFAIALALMLGWLLERSFIRLPFEDSNTLRRLTYVLMTSLGCVYLLTFYIYPPAQDSLSVIRSIWERIAILFLDVQKTSTVAYQQVQAGWISLPVYFILTLSDWFMLVGSFAVWFWLSWQWFIRGIKPSNQTIWLVWLFYTAFALQGAISVVADVAGVLGSNLQHRLFPSFAIFAIALVAIVLVEWIKRCRSRWVLLICGACIFCFSILSAFKVTNEPLLSNNWTFYNSDELIAFDWVDGHMQNSLIWADYNERLTTAALMQNVRSSNWNEFTPRLEDDELRTFLITDVIRVRSLRLGLPLPVPYDGIQVYDNGSSQIYHQRPQTQYQR